MKKTGLSVILILFATIAFTGCGRKGALTLPKQQLQLAAQSPSTYVPHSK